MLRSALLDRHERSTRDRILDAAKELFARRGYTGTSIRMIAERAGVTDPALYYYYPTKRALHDALLDPPYLDDMESSGGDLDTAIDWLIAMFMRYADNGDLVRLSLRELLSGDPAAMAFRRQAEAEYREAMGGFLRAQYGGAAETIQDIVTLMLSGVFWDAILRYGDRFEEVVHEDHFQQWLRDLIRTALPPSSGEWR